MVHPVTRQARAWKLSTRQHAGDTSHVLTINTSRNGYALPNAINATAPARKVKVLKSGVRRITYR